MSGGMSGNSDAASGRETGRDSGGEAAIMLAELATITGGRWLGAPPAGSFVGAGIDSREALEGRVFFAIRGERFDGHDFLDAIASAGAVAAIVERDLSSSTPGATGAPVARERAVPTYRNELPRLLVPSSRAALAQIARAWRTRHPARFAAVTGSCGKTTTRRLLASILERVGATTQSPKSFNNELGVPLTVLAARPLDRFVVTEVGMNHSGEIRPLAEIVRPHVAVITSIGRVHLEALGSVEAIAREKASIIDGVETDGVIVAPAESAVAMNAVMEAVERRGNRHIHPFTFGLTAGDAKLHSRRVVPGGSEVELDGPWGRVRTVLMLPGEHNAMNALAAACAAHRLGVRADAIRDGLSLVTPSEMRFVRQTVGALTVINDAYNANPESMRASVRAFAESEHGASRRVVVLGDMLELGAASMSLHSELGAWLAEAFDGAPPDFAVFVGSQSAHAARSFAREAPGASRLLLPDAGAASAETLRVALRPGDSILVKASRGMALERAIALLATPAAPMSSGSR